MRCLWCHSPESQALEAQVAWFEMKCIGVAACGKCFGACPKGALKKGKVLASKTEKADIQVVDLDREACDNCGKCTEVCAGKALSMAGADMTVDEVMTAVDKDRPFYRKSGGGVTVSGGEPMVQHRFLTLLLKECKDKGLHTCLDTTGYAKWDLYEEVLEYVDLFLYDLKHMNSDRHRQLTAVPNELHPGEREKVGGGRRGLPDKNPHHPRLQPFRGKPPRRGRLLCGIGRGREGGPVAPLPSARPGEVRETSEAIPIGIRETPQRRAHGRVQGTS